VGGEHFGRKGDERSLSILKHRIGYDKAHCEPYGWVKSYQ